MTRGEKGEKGEMVEFARSERGEKGESSSELALSPLTPTMAKPVDRIVSNGATTRSDQVKAALASDPTLAWLPARLRKTFGPGVRLTYLETPAYRDGTPPAIPNSDLFTEYRT